MAVDDLRLLRVLREVASRGSFSAAADVLGYTQPAVSQQIARLEKLAGVRLLHRDARHVQLTPAGEVLVRRTDRILAEVAAAEAELGEVAAEARGRLRIGSFSTAAGTIVPQAIARFRTLRPAVDVQLRLVDPPESIPAVRRGDLEIAITEEAGFSGEVDTTGLRQERLLEDPLYAALPLRHPAARDPTVALADLADEDWIIVEGIDYCGDGNVVRDACRAAGFEPRALQAAHDYFAILGLVASGMGVALVPGLALVTARDDVAIRPLAGPPPRRRIGAVTAPGEPAGALATMLESLRAASR